VAASTLKLDGIIFVLGGLFGVWAFGESVGYFEDFFYSSYFGRLTLYDWLGISPGAVVFLVVLMALVMFYFAEIAEAHFGEPQQEITWRPYNTWKISAASLLVASAAILFSGQPTPWPMGSLAEQLVKNLTTGRSCSSRRVLELKRCRHRRAFWICGPGRISHLHIAELGSIRRLPSRLR
jgi:hypothetical protein